MNSKTKTFELGQRLLDLVSGIEGIAVARLEHLNGCVHYGIKPKAGDDNKEIDAIYVDSQQLELVDEGINKKVVRNNTGGSLKGAPKL